MSEQDQAPHEEPRHPSAGWYDTPDPNPSDEPTTDPEPDPEPTDPPADESESSDPPETDDPPVESEGGETDSTVTALNSVVEELRKTSATWQNAVNRFNNNPTEQNRQAAEKARTKLDELMDRDDLDLDGSAIKTLAGELQSSQKQQGETFAQYEQRTAQLEQELASLREREVRREFEKQHPDLNYDQLVQQVQQELASVQQMVASSTDPSTAQLYRELAAQKWQAAVQKASQSKAKPKTEKPAKPKNTSPVKGNGGTRTASDTPRTPAEILYGGGD